MRADSMEDYHVAANAIDEEQVRAQVALGEASQIEGAPPEAVFLKLLRRLFAGNQHFEDVIKRLAVEFRMFSGNTVVALEARQNDQLSSHRIASRPVRKRCPLPAVSSYSDSFSAALSAADERFGFARTTQAFRAASAFLSPVRALSVLIS